MEWYEVLFPQHVKCIFCDCEVPDKSICSECYKKLPFISGDTCIKCGGRIIGEGYICMECMGKDTHITQTYCVLDYEGEVSKVINNFKNHGQKYIGITLAQLMLEKFKTIETDFDYIIPVPLHSNREKERGFNQSIVLCEEIAEYTNKVEKDLLKRCRDTMHQTGLYRKNRIENIHKAFEVVDNSKIKGKCILLVDDIYTTGSTINECAKTLLDAGADKVYALCLARTPIRNRAI